MKAVILAAGKSTRTYPLTLTRPKPLLPIANKPILAHQLDALSGLVDGVVLVVGYRHEMIRERFGDRYKDISIEYIEQTEQKGTGHAVLQTAGAIDGPFLAMHGDDLFDPKDLARLAAPEQAALAKTVEDPRLYGIFEVTEEMNVVRLVEKPVEIFSKLANIGAYKFTPEVFEVLRNTPPTERGEIEVTCAVHTLAQAGAFKVVETEGYWLPMGYPWHLLDVNEYWLANHFEEKMEGEVHPTAVISGPVSIGKGTVVGPGVVIEGPVIIGENCKLGPNTYLRPGTTMGNGSKAGQGTELKNTILFEGAAVPHLSYVGDSVVGEKANLGCGTVTANFRHDGSNHWSMVKGERVDTGRRKFGAIIGDHVHTGIHTAIYPGRKLGPGVSTLPGQVVSEDIEG